MRVVVSGASGLIGTALRTRLSASGHEVVQLVRRPPTHASEVRWDPQAGHLDVDALGDVDAAVNLSGVGVGDKRWDADYRDLILTSRTESTSTLATALAAMPRPPSVLVQASASGYYGERGDEIVDEASAPGDEFLAGVCVAWEAAAQPARDAGIRVTSARTGLVMTTGGGAFGPLLPLIRLNLGGPLGNGSAWWSWITLEDEVAAIEWLLTADHVDGPVNLVSPEPARNGDLVRAVAAALGRKALLPAPAFALRAALGEFAEEVLASRRINPSTLVSGGFSFAHGDVETAAHWLADQVRSSR